MAGYWPNSFCLCFCRLKKKAKKERVLYRVILAKQNLSIYKGFIIKPKREPFLAGPALEIPRGQDGPILPAQVTSQNTGLLYLARSRIHQYNYTFHLTLLQNNHMEGSISFSNVCFSIELCSGQTKRLINIIDQASDGELELKETP